MSGRAQTWEEGAEDAAALIRRHGATSATVPEDRPLEHTLQWLDEEVQSVYLLENMPAALVLSYLWIGSIALSVLGAEQLDDIVALAARKQHDYGNKNILGHGHVGISVRMTDKLARIRNLSARSDFAVNESLRDSWVDLVGYSIVGLMLLVDTFTLPLFEDSGSRSSASSYPSPPEQPMLDGLGSATPEAVNAWIRSHS